MTKKNFIALAEWFATMGDRRMTDPYVLNELMVYLKETNPRFDAERFEAYVENRRLFIDND